MFKIHQSKRPTVQANTFSLSFQIVISDGKFYFNTDHGTKYPSKFQADEDEEIMYFEWELENK